jgi:hypothetical protein
VLGGIVAALETSAEAPTPSVQRALEDLRQIRKQKEDSLELPIKPPPTI